MTKDEIKAKIAEITKENTTESLHADILNAIVDAMPEGGGNWKEITGIIVENSTLSMSEFTSQTGLTLQDLIELVSGESLGCKYNTSGGRILTYPVNVGQFIPGESLYLILGTLGIDCGDQFDWIYNYETDEVSIYYGTI